MFQKLLRLSGLLKRAIRPVLTPLEQMLALLKLLPPKVASKQGPAVLVNAISEVLAGDAAAAALLSLQLPLVNERPLLPADLS